VTGSAGGNVLAAETSLLCTSRSRCERCDVARQRQDPNPLQWTRPRVKVSLFWSVTLSAGPALPNDQRLPQFTSQTGSTSIDTYQGYRLGVARRTDLQLLVDALKGQPGEQASPRRLGERLGWDADKVRRVAAKANADPMTPLFIGKGGVIKHRGSERGASVGIYADVAHVIETSWGPGEMRLRDINTVVTARSGRRNGGVWTHPDLVIAADPPRRKSQDEPHRLHSIEIETADGFDLRSVYQAHAQGRGANYSWVFGSKAPGVEKADWDRILWTVDELGIGLVTFTKPHVYSTWITHRQADFKEPTREERRAFLERTMNAADRAAIGL